MRERTAENETTDLLERPRHLAVHSGRFAFVLQPMEASEGVCTWGSRDFQNGNCREAQGGTREAARASLALDEKAEAPGLGSLRPATAASVVALEAKKV